MRKIFVLALLVLGTIGINAQETSKKSKPSAAKVVGAGMVYVSETIDYGTIAQNADGRREFVFTNNGNAPLIITNTQGSCGCTVPSKPTGEIMPGKSDFITVKYNMATGPIRKTITVESNAANYEGGRIALKIKGEVLE